MPAPHPLPFPPQRMHTNTNHPAGAAAAAHGVALAHAARSARPPVPPAPAGPHTPGAHHHPTSGSGQPQDHTGGAMQVCVVWSGTACLSVRMGVDEDVGVDVMVSAHTREHIRANPHACALPCRPWCVACCTCICTRARRHTHTHAHSSAHIPVRTTQAVHGHAVHGIPHVQPAQGGRRWRRLPCDHAAARPAPAARAAAAAAPTGVGGTSASGAGQAAARRSRCDARPSITYPPPLLRGAACLWWLCVQPCKLACCAEPVTCELARCVACV